MNKVRRLFYTFTTLILVFFIYKVSILLLSVGFESASRDIFFISLSLYLFFPLLKNIKIKKDLSEDAVITKKISNIYKKIKDKDTTALIGLTLKDNNISVDIDSIIINDKGVFNIVFCNYKGDIIIKDYNTWVKETRGGHIELVSPINKIKRKREILNKIFEEDEINDVIVMTDDRVDVYEEESSSIPIIKYDDIENYVDEYNNDKTYIPEKLYDKLYPYIFKEKDLNKEIAFYEKYLDNKWQYRSRFAVISLSLVFYIFKVIEYK